MFIEYDKSPFITSGVRIGTPAITTRGLVESDMENIVILIDRVLMNHTNDEIIEEGDVELGTDKSHYVSMNKVT